MLLLPPGAETERVLERELVGSEAETELEQEQLGLGQLEMGPMFRLRLLEEIRNELIATR